MVHFHGTDANDDAQTLIQDLHVGGIIFYNWSNGLTSFDQVKKLCSGLQDSAKANRVPIPLLLACDQEGGVVARLQTGFTLFPGNKALGMTGDPELSERSAFAIGQELLSAGVNMNLAPVVDINSNPKNPVIGIRSFGETPEIVTTFARSALSGYGKAQITTCLKHFPGHGDVGVDSHCELPFLSKTKEELMQNELRPFQELASISDTIMTAHLMVPSIDPDNCATLSPKILKILREEIGFSGPIVTDSLVMEGLLKNCPSIDEAAIRSIEAGCDIVLLGGKQLVGKNASLELTVDDVRRVHQSIVQAVRSERISEERLNQSVLRILELKNRYKKAIPTTWNIQEHTALVSTIASHAIQNMQNKPLPPIAESKILLVAPQTVEAAVNDCDLLQKAKKSDSLFFSGLNPSEEEKLDALSRAQSSDIIIFCSYNAWKNPAQDDLIQRLLGANKPFVLIALRDSQDAELYTEASQVILTHSPTKPSILAAFARLMLRS